MKKKKVKKTKSVKVWVSFIGLRISQKVNKELLPEYIEQGWFLGKNIFLIDRMSKKKQSYTDADKIKALSEFNGNIRQALFSLGLNDSGPHYKK